MEKLSGKKEVTFLSQPYPVSMADEWFEMANQDHFWMKWRFEVVLTQFKKAFKDRSGGTKYLEIGCGHGQFIKQFESQNDLCMDGCDLNLYALNKIGSIRGDVYVYDIFNRQTDMVGKYDSVFLLDVIEHVDDDVAFLKAALDHIKIDGGVIINVPALSALFSKYDTQAGHKRRYNAQGIRKLFVASGITPIYIGYWGFLLLPIAFIRKFYLKLIPNEKVINKGFVPPSKFISSLLECLMKFELLVWKKPLLGTSIVAIGKRME